jgi:nitrate reductase molybdenum cofactor assembly chaperone NarJ/NarW
VRATRKPPAASREQLSAVWQSVSLLLDYPDEQLLGSLPLTVQATHHMPEPAAELIGQFVAHLESTPLAEVQAAYVDTFDNRRRCNLFLTYFAHGDTRKRGMALLRFKQTYLDSGVVLDDSELPDHLCVVLEYAATVDQERGRKLLLDHRAGLELLKLSLRDTDSPWSPLVEAVTATLPALRGEEHDAVRRLAAEGPPEEEVGLAPFATPEFSPSAQAFGQGVSGSPVALPMPTLRTGHA